MSKHTPGPWIVHIWQRDHVTSKGEKQPRIKYQVLTEDGSPIEATTSNEHNARLIAAAPELLSALQFLLGDPAGQITEGGRARAIAAIAKATGDEDLIVWRSSDEGR